MSKPLWQAPLRGEYYADDDAHYITDAVDNVIAEIPPVHGLDAKEMADTIAHRVNTYPALIAENERLRAALESILTEAEYGNTHALSRFRAYWKLPVTPRQRLRRKETKMPTLNEIYADLVKWGMPEVEGLRYYRMPNAPPLDRGVWLLAVMTETSDVDGVIPHKAAEAIVTQHALECLADTYMRSGAFLGASKTRTGWSVRFDDMTTGKGAALILAIWDAAKQLGSEG